MHPNDFPLWAKKMPRHTSLRAALLATPQVPKWVWARKGKGPNGSKLWHVYRNGTPINPFDGQIALCGINIEDFAYLRFEIPTLHPMCPTCQQKMLLAEMRGD